MGVRSWIDRLTSPEARQMLRTAAHLVLDFVGDDRPDASGAEAAAASSDAAKVVSAVAATASVAERLVSAATKATRATRASSKKRSGRGGKIALGIAVGAAVIGGIAWVASPKGRAKARELWHTARGWRKPRPSNGSPVEVPPPL